MTNDAETRYRSVANVLLFVLVLNWLVAAAKIAYGLVTQCASMTADGFHSLADGSSNVLGLFGIFMASKPKDDDHPYGHRKFETLFALGIAGMLFFVMFNLAKQGIDRFRTPVMPEINAGSFIVMALTMVVNFAVMRYENRRGKALRSDILVADSMHTRSDIFTSLTVIIALVGMKFGLPFLDPVATLIISCFIGYAALNIVRQESAILCDAAVITDLKKIEEIVLKVKGVKSCHKIRSRGRPDDIHLDLHVRLAPDTHLDMAHEISHTIEIDIKKEIKEVADVLVHLEPAQ